MPTTPTPEDLARRIVEVQHGVVTRSQLRAAGLNPNQIDHLGRSPRWRRLTDEVLALAGSPPTHRQRTMVAVIDCGPSAVLSHTSAAALWGLTSCALEPFHVTRLGASRRRSSRAVIHQVRQLPVGWRTTLEQIPVARPEMVALQLFATCREERAERLVERLWSNRLLSGRSIERFLHEMGRSGRNGTAGLRRYLEARGPGYTPSASNIESRVTQILRPVGIELRTQVDSGDDHWTGRVDFRHLTLPLIVEVQSQLHHGALMDATADVRRLAELRAGGFVVVELWDTEVWTRPDLVVTKVRDGVAQCLASRPHDAA